MYLQYTGETPHYKVFVNIAPQLVKYPCGEFVLLKGVGGLLGSLAPIHPSEFEKYLTMDARVFVYRVRRYGEIFIAAEEYRNSQHHHLPGYLFIKDIGPGTIIPIHGIASKEFLSNADKVCIADPNKVHEYRQLDVKRRTPLVEARGVGICLE